MRATSLSYFLLATLASSQVVDEWARFPTPICTPINKAIAKLPATAQQNIVQFCFDFVGTTTTTLTLTLSTVYSTTPASLKTITVSANRRARFVRAETEEVIPTPTPVITRTPTHNNAPTPAITSSPEHFIHHELKRAKKPLITPAYFKGWLSKAIKTGCKCQGISTLYTMPTTVTTDYTTGIPASCVLKPFSAYHLSSYSPASAVAVAYEYGWFDVYEDNMTVSPEEYCCRDCQSRWGCVQFVIEHQDPAEHFGSPARCNYYYLDDYFGENTISGYPTIAGRPSTECPNGYLGVNGLVKDTEPTTSSTATFLGPCAAVVVTR
ncbi:hypothetical protein P154DRAFT_39018 [Amniculicola lignicola CBS 123094]|uniref:Apple domain-containing protein n=1 Tax=Amniculicola lignicola CBS 123094 TaxID=1392246 RepID=A0A6A5W971_9PLEO|nr:hypothetical protein P154DRAFT_39018 [Amniculicola lignicola CBS 123094]